MSTNEEINDQPENGSNSNRLADNNPFSDDFDSDGSAIENVVADFGNFSLGTWVQLIANNGVRTVPMKRTPPDIKIKHDCKDGADTTSNETQSDPPPTVASKLEFRGKVRQAICENRLLVAQKAIHEMYPTFFKIEEKLCFKFNQLQLINFIRTDRIWTGLDFARKEITTTAEKYPELRADLDNCLALIVFTEPKVAGPLMHLVSTEFREEVAVEINNGLLKWENGMPSSEIPRFRRFILKNKKWVPIGDRDGTVSE